MMMFYKLNPVLFTILSFSGPILSFWFFSAAVSKTCKESDVMTIQNKVVNNVADDIHRLLHNHVLKGEQ